MEAKNAQIFLQGIDDVAITTINATWNITWRVLVARIGDGAHA